VLVPDTLIVYIPALSVGVTTTLVALAPVLHV
jgi:hypothetical protein